MADAMTTTLLKLINMARDTAVNFLTQQDWYAM